MFSTWGGGGGGGTFGGGQLVRSIPPPPGLDPKNSRGSGPNSARGISPPAHTGFVGERGAGAGYRSVNCPALGKTTRLAQKKKKRGGVWGAKVAPGGENLRRAGGDCGFTGGGQNKKVFSIWENEKKPKRGGN